jgi:hypothetical protein
LRILTCVIVSTCLACAEKPPRSDAEGAAAHATAASAAIDPATDTSLSGADSAFLAQLNAVENYAHQEASAFARAAMARARVDSALAIALLARLAVADSVWASLRERPAAPDTAFAGVVERWFQAAGALSTDRQAAAYVGADMVLAQAFVGLGLWDRTPISDGLREMLGRLGAEIEWHESDAEFAYMHSWLAEAIRIDPNGPTGIEARLWRLAHWCDAGRGGDRAREARADAEDLLVRNLSPVQLARAHYYAGEASRDLVTFAHPHEWVFVDTALYAGGEVEARQAAITHYRAALGLDSASENAVDAAAQLRVLLSDGSPEAVRFGCWQGE